tara:strand:- start:1961 stop:3013 length:1053 start_codon:yes stop_codon:yes gene_type:complete
MKSFIKNLSKIVFTNFLIVIFFIILIELFFGYWFDKYNFGPYMREHRMKNQPTTFKYEGKIYTYNYKRNYYGFRGEDVDPSNINAVIMGGSDIDERYKPDEFTITEYLNKLLKENNYDLKILNAGIEAQSTVGIIYNFNHWFTKLENFSPKLILLYIGLSDTGIPENFDLSKSGREGHIKNPDKIEVFFDNIKSRSLLYDSLRIFKFKYLPRKNFVKYDGDIDPNREKDFSYIEYETALQSYDLNKIQKKYEIVIKNFLSRVDVLYEKSKKIKAKPIFITSVRSQGNTEINFIFNHSLILHCKNKNYNCINVAKKLKGKYNYWRDGTHTTREGSKVIANLIFEDLENFLK